MRVMINYSSIRVPCFASQGTQGCSGSSSSIWGEEGTAQANQCCCQAAGGAFPKLRDRRRACLKKVLERGRRETALISLTPSPNVFVVLLALQSSEPPSFRSARC